MRRPRVRFTVITLMIVVAVFAILTNWFRPISQSEAVQIATIRFRQIPGASAWTKPGIRSYFSGGGDGKSYWIVNFVDPANDQAVAQVSTDERGKVVSTLVSMPGSAAPIPAEFATEPIPPPK